MKLDQILSLPEVQALDLNPSQKAILQALPRIKRPALHAARSAVFHLARAKLLETTDREMAAFRIYTAEEESVSAIIRSIQRIKYPGAATLKYDDHRHKAAVFLLMQLLHRQIPLFDGLKVNLAINVKHKSYPVILHFGLPPPFQHSIQPDEPLNFRLGKEGGVDWGVEMKDLAKALGAKSLDKAIKDRANRRNMCLYASEKGVPLLTHPPTKLFERTKDLVFNNLLVALMIDQTMQKQALVQQCVEVLAKMVPSKKARKRRRK